MSSGFLFLLVLSDSNPLGQKRVPDISEVLCTVYTAYVEKVWKDKEYQTKGKKSHLSEA